MDPLRRRRSCKVTSHSPDTSAVAVAVMAVGEMPVARLVIHGPGFA